MKWVRKYSRLKFLDGGRDFGGVDCWGLVRLIYENELGIHLPEYGEISAHDLKNASKAMVDGDASGKWKPVCRNDLKEFDIVAMRFYGHSVVGHVGVAVTASTIIHIEPKVNVAIVPVSNPLILNRIYGFRRFIE